VICTQHAGEKHGGVLLPAREQLPPLVLRGRQSHDVGLSLSLPGRLLVPRLSPLPRIAKPRLGPVFKRRQNMKPQTE